MSRDTLKALTTREQCRDKISVWYGSADNYLHGLREVIANGVDEMVNNFDEGRLIMTLEDDLQTMVVRDTGRGIPLNGRAKDKDGNVKMRYEILFETLFSGTNYDNNENGKITTGTNGCGTCVLNYTSDVFEVRSFISDEEISVHYEDGGEFKELKKNKTQEYHGTEFKFRLSDKVYTNTIYDIPEVRKICDVIAGVTPNITFEFRHKDQVEIFKYDGIKDYFDKNANELTSDMLMENEVSYDDSNEINVINLVIASTGSEEPLQYTYLNNTYLPENGTIYDGIISGARLYFNKYIQAKNMYEKKESTIKEKDVVSALSFICSVNSTNVSYANQTKFSTSKKLYEVLSKRYIQERLEIFEAEYPVEIKKIADQILLNKRANEKTVEYMNKVKKKLEKKVSNMENKIEGFVDCKYYGNESMIFLTEGLSALGSIILAREPEYQAGFPLKGKIKNILKEKDFNKILNNTEISSLIQVLGCGIESRKKSENLFNKNNLRYGKIIIATDQDSDGLHIQCLVLVVFYKLMPTLIKDGHLYILQTPLFEIRDVKNDEMHYAYSENQRDEIISKLDKYQINRNKGLGEIQPETMSECIDAKKGLFTQVKWEEVEEMEKWFDILMGDNLTERKEFVENNLHLYVDMVE